MTGLTRHFSALHIIALLKLNEFMIRLVHVGEYCTVVFQQNFLILGVIEHGKHVLCLLYMHVAVAPLLLQKLSKSKHFLDKLI